MMIISCSRRTDIPALYSDWLFQRVREGFVCVRNPRNPQRISKYSLSPDAVDGFVFWTKNPAPMLPRLHELSQYAYYFQYTLTPYGKDIEPGLPVKIKLLSAFERLSGQIGPERVVWRYDPILVNRTWTVDAHLRAFAMMAKLLEGRTRRVIISFLGMEYQSVRRNAALLAAEELPARERLNLAGKLAQIADRYGMEMSACAQDQDFSACGILPAHCVDGELFEKLLGCRLQLSKDPGQREACGCVRSVDIGAYNSCTNICRYCYANYNPAQTALSRRRNNPASPLLLGEIGPLDQVVEREAASCRDDQMALVGF